MKKNAKKSAKKTTSRKALVIEKGVMRVTADDSQKKTRKTFKKTLSSLFDVQILEKASKTGFKFMEGINRAIIPAQVTKLAESVNKMGIVRPVVVADLYFNGLNGTYIIDGQHLYFALMRENSDIPYVKIEITNSEELVEYTALLNSTSKSWQLKDYVQVWSFIRPDYKKLTHYFNQYDFEVQTIAAILSGKSANGGGINSMIKRGTFTVKNETKSVKILDYVTDVLKIVPRMDRFSNRLFVGAYVEYVSLNFSAYNHTKFCAYLKQNIKQLTFVNGDKDNILSFFNDCN